MQPTGASQTPFRFNSKESGNLYSQVPSNYPKSDYSKTQFRKYSEMSQSSQTSQSTPENGPATKEHNTAQFPFNNIKATKLDFSSFGETEKKGPSNFLLQKIRNINSTSTEQNMDIEVSDFTLTETKKENKSRETPNNFQELLKSLTPPKKEDLLLEGPVVEERDEGEIYPQPKQKEPTLIK
jgi:hypothetical protein